ncbi:MAG: transposase, partial [Acidobacteriota bacterium]
RRNLISPEIEPELYAYLGGTLKKLGSVCLAMNGTANHVHLLISQSKNAALSVTLQELKKGSSKWIKTKGEAFRHFAWQDGYGAFSVGQSNVGRLKTYLAEQKSHHQKNSFESELLALLDKYKVNYDPRYIWT